MNQPAFGTVTRKKVALIALGIPALLPIFFMSRAIITANNNTMNQAVADVLGTGSETLLFLTLLISPLALVTRQRWFTPLRKWYGIMFGVTAIVDATTASITTAFAGGVLGRLTGHVFLLVGLTMVALIVPTLFTANNRAMRWLGKYWRWVQRLTYAIWALLFVHLALLFAFGPKDPGDTIFHQRFFQVVFASIVLVTFRLPPVKRWVAEKQKENKGAQVYALFIPLMVLFVIAFGFMISEEIFKGAAAFSLHPIND